MKNFTDVFLISSKLTLEQPSCCPRYARLWNREATRSFALNYVVPHIPKRLGPLLGSPPLRPKSHGNFPTSGYSRGKSRMHPGNIRKHKFTSPFKGKLLSELLLKLVHYGLTQKGGTDNNNGGVFFSFDLGLPPSVRLLPEANRVGQTVGIFGQGFTGTTAVNFNGTPASFTVVSDTYLVAPVPSGATTGPVTVTTPTGTFTSNKKLQIRPQVLNFTPASGPVGTTVVITGVSLGGVTSVTFDGVETSFTQNADTQVTATVPNGALTGHVGVTTTGAASYGHSVFTVNP